MVARGHVGATERLDRRWIDERKIHFGVQYSISRKQSFFFFGRELIGA
jgi:hypothetical protein